MSRIKELRKNAEVALPPSGELYYAEDGTMSMVLEDNFDPTFEPSDTELIDYAEWLGMKFPEDDELLWVAREGLKAPLPKEWKPCKTDSGEVYYFNFKSGESLWDHPMDEHFKNKFAEEKEKLLAGKPSGKPRGYVETQKNKNETRLVLSDKGTLSPVAVSARSESPPRRDTGRGGVTTPSSLNSTMDRKATPTNSASATPVKATAATTSQPKATPVDKSSMRKQDSIMSVTEDSGSSSFSGKPSLGGMPSTSSLPKKDTPKAALSLDPPTSNASPSAATLGTTTPRTSSGLSLTAPALISESARQRQEKLKREVEDEHREAVASLENDFAERLADERKKYERQAEKRRTEHNATKRRRADDEETYTNECLDRDRRNVEADGKYDLQRMEKQVEEVQARIRDAVAQAKRRQEDELERVRATLPAMVRESEARVKQDIEHLRTTHQQAQEQKLQEMRDEIDAKVQKAQAAAHEDAERRMRDRLAQVQREYDDTKQRMFADADREVAARAERARQAASGQSAAAAAELRQKTASEVQAIEAQCGQDVEALRSQDAATIAQLKQQHEVAVINERQNASASSANADALRAQQVESRLAQAAREHEARVEEIRRAKAAEQQQRMDSVRAEMRQSAGTSSAPALHLPTAQEVDFETSRTLETLRAEHAQALQTLRQATASDNQNAVQAEKARLDAQLQAWRAEAQAKKAHQAQSQSAAQQQAMAAEERRYEQEVAALKAKFSSLTASEIAAIDADVQAKLSHQRAAIATEAANRRNQNAAILAAHEQAVAAAAAAAATPASAPPPQQTQIIGVPPEREHEMLEAALRALRAEFADAEARARQQLMAARSTSDALDVGGPGVSPVRATSAVAPHRGGAPPMDSTAQQQRIHDTVAVLRAQQHQRETGLLQARREWERDMARATAAEREVLARVGGVLDQHEAKLRSEKLKIERGVPATHADPAAPSGGGAQDEMIMTFLRTVDEKVEKLAATIAAASSAQHTHRSRSAGARGGDERRPAKRSKSTNAHRRDAVETSRSGRTPRGDRDRDVQRGTTAAPAKCDTLHRKWSSMLHGLDARAPFATNTAPSGGDAATFAESFKKWLHNQ